MSIYNEEQDPAPVDENGLLAKLVLQRCSEVAVSNEDVARYEEIWKGPTVLLANLVNNASAQTFQGFPTFFVGREHPVWAESWAFTRLTDIPASPSGKWYIENLRLQQCDGGEHSLLTVEYASALKNNWEIVIGAKQIGTTQWQLSYNTVLVSPYFYLHERDAGRFHIENSIQNETALNSKTNNDPNVWYDYAAKQTVNLTAGEKEVRAKIVAGKQVERVVPVVRCTRHYTREEDFDLSGYWQNNNCKIGYACHLPSGCPYTQVLPPFVAQPFLYCGPSLTIDFKYKKNNHKYENVTLVEQWQGMAMDYDRDFYGDLTGGAPWIPGTK